MKIRPMGAELFHAGRQTDGRTDRRHEAHSRFFAIMQLRLKDTPFGTSSISQILLRLQINK
jgi:hypothetical protein